MSEERVGALGGLWFAILTVAAGVLLPKPPAADASAATIGHYLSGHHERIQIASALSALAAIGFLVLVVGLRQRLAVDPIAARLTLSGGVVVVTVGVLGALVQATSAQVADRLGSDATVLSFAMTRAIFYIAPGFAVLMVFAGVARGFRKAGLPAWLAGLGLLIAAIGAVGGVGQLTSTSSAVAALGFVGFVLTVVWVAATSVVLLRVQAQRHPLAVPATAH